MEDINKGARPDIAPYLQIEAVDFKVTDPAAADPNVPVRMLYTNQPFKMHFTLRVVGYFVPSLVNEKWETRFYADSLGVDVRGEVKWNPPDAELPRVIGDTFEISHTVNAGLATPGIYEFGAVTRLPRHAINAYIEGYHLEVADF